MRYNFRGIGETEGAHDDGRGESDDLVAIAQWVLAQKPGAVLWLAGFFVRKLR